MLRSINNRTKKIAPEDAISQIVSVLPRIIKAMALTPIEGGTAYLASWTSQKDSGAWSTQRGRSRTLLTCCRSTLTNQWRLWYHLCCRWDGPSCGYLSVIATYVANSTESLPVHPVKD